jgi:hypothetical protein
MAPARTMLITRAGGWTERDGRWTALSAPAAAHERAQFAMYGLMLIRPLAERGAAVRPLGGRDGLQGLAVTHPGAPATDLWFDGEGRLREALNRIADPDGGGAVDQRFRFSSDPVSTDPWWPRRLAIEWNGRPYFELEISRFAARAQAPPPPAAA